MASCSLGVPKIKISAAVDLSLVRSGRFQIPCNQRVLLIGQRPVKYLSLRATLGSVQASTVTAAESAATVEVEDTETTKPSPLNAQLVPKPSEVEALVTEICDSSSIAEFELKLGGFRLYVARNLADNNSSPPQPQPIPAAVAASATTESVDSNGSASSTSLAITKPTSSAADQGLVILQSPKVGFFRRSKTIKGKRTPSSCKEKDQVKEGQVLCYIEQLGGQFPIESDVTGEVVKILREDGEPVGYNDALISILPSFPGIKKLQ
ncbi:biotin carboxyl carrier protein of acetyl-CoA carboxylase [Brassica rapa]|uniref:Lipoyl-binding domain-containing protein n=1 Tax=Brassica campestris TaxID=3711 RepID=M4EEK5_BRACM|nr:biotin carboxyl carrier protein of acetyl-CoA carboxylase [Brassica rapa]